MPTFLNALDSIIWKISYFLMNSINHIYSCLTGLREPLDEIPQYSIEDSIGLFAGLLASSLIILCILKVYKRARNKVIRPKSFSQHKHLRSAKVAYNVVLKSELDSETMLEKIKLEGFSYELLVLFVFQHHTSKLKWIATPKLTADYGMDGVVVAGNTVYVIQSKYYASAVSIGAVRELCKLVERLNSRKEGNNWHRSLGIPQKYSRDLSIRFLGVLATTGRLSENSRLLCLHNKIHVFYWSLLVDTVKKKSLIFH